MCILSYLWLHKLSLQILSEIPQDLGYGEKIILERVYIDATNLIVCVICLRLNKFYLSLSTHFAKNIVFPNADK